MNPRHVALAAVLVAALAAGGYLLHASRRRAGTAVAQAEQVQRERFAKEVLARVQAQPDGKRARYDADRFEIDLPATDGGWKSELFLGNAFDEYRAATAAADREAIIARAGTLRPPVDFGPFASVRSKLLPAVRERTFFAQAAQQARDIGRDGGSPLPFVPLGELYGAAVVIDEPESMDYVTADALRKWSKSLPEALEVARANLEAKSAGAWEHPAPGVCVSPWHDDYDASRVLLDDVLARCKVDGAPVVMLPNRDTLIVAGDRDEPALLELAKLTKAQLGAPRLMSARAMRRTATGWQPFMPPASSSAYRPFHELELISLQRDYEDQKSVLQKQLDDKGQDVFVASFQVMQNRQGDQLSVSTLTRGVETLLPHTELVALVDLDKPQGENLRAMAHWDAFAKLMGPRLTKEPGLVPERFRVRGFPTERELGRLGFALPRAPR